MAERTTIEWTDATWNPVRGCSVVSPGCTNCYAMRQAHRHNYPGGPYEGLTTGGGTAWSPGVHKPIWSGKIKLVPELLDAPLHWRRPRHIFVNSMSDLFHENVPDEFIANVFCVMARCPQHVFQILTKRPKRMQLFCSRESHWWGNKADIARRADYGKPLPNVWLGVSVEDQARADERIPLLLQTPAAIMWISAEPLLGPINLKHEWLPALRWVVVGGESGPGARPHHLAWASHIIAQGRAAGIATFFKQAGSWPALDGVTLRLKDRKGGDLSELPTEFNVREYPL